MTYGKAGEVIKDFLESRFKSYQIVLETLLKDSGFMFDCVKMPY